jgi:hypothetical protein
MYARDCFLSTVFWNGLFSMVLVLVGYKIDTPRWSWVVYSSLLAICTFLSIARKYQVLIQLIHDCQK